MSTITDLFAEVVELARRVKAGTLLADKADALRRASRILDLLAEIFDKRMLVGAEEGAMLASPAVECTLDECASACEEHCELPDAAPGAMQSVGALNPIVLALITKLIEKLLSELLK